MSDLNAGIYEICNLKNGKRYFGSTNDFDWREYCHFSDLRAGCHDNRYLQNAFNASGEEVFEFNILVFLDPDRMTLRMIEQLFLDFYEIPNPDVAYNINPSAYGNSPESARELYRRGKGIASLTPEQRSEVSRKAGRKSGSKLFREGLGLFSLSREQRQAISRMGGSSSYRKRAGIHSQTPEERLDLSRRGGAAARDKRVGIYARSPEQHSADSQKAGRISTHNRWHVRRKKPNPECDLCITEGLIEKN